jgi:spermidine/putrescine transport system substrate-binding protein
MNSKDFKEKLKTGKVSRREVNKILASVGIGIVSASMAGFGRSALAASSSLQVFTWSTYDKPGLHTDFSEKYGGSPEFTILTSNGDSRAKVRSGFRPDLAAPTWSHVPFWKSEDLLEKIDVSRLKHWPELFDRLQDLDPVDEKYSIPWSWGNTAIVYRKDLVPEEYLENQTWGLLWEEKIKGKIAIRDAIMGAVLPAGLYAGVDDAWNMTDADFEKVGELMRKQRDLTKFYWKGEGEVQQALASGEVVAATGWNSTYATLKKQGVDVGFMVPKEGMPTWVDAYVMIKGGPAPEQEKYDFLDAVMSAEAGALIIEELGYGAANKKSWEIADAKAVESLGVGDVQSTVDAGMWSKAVPTDVKDKMVDLLNRVKAGF